VIGSARRDRRPAGPLAADLLLYGLSGLFALLTAATSTLAPHRAWGAVAVAGYGAATLLVALQLLLCRRAPRPAGVTARAVLTGVTARAVLTGVTWLATAVLPLLLQAYQRAGGRGDRAQEEVVVIERGGQRLLETGTPYLTRAAIAALPGDERLLGYLPYQPGMALFGLPRAAFGPAWWTDARVWFALVTTAALVAALLVAHRAGARAGALLRATQAATVLPICALTLAVGGDDLPVLALCLLSLALAAHAPRPGCAPPGDPPPGYPPSAGPASGDPPSAGPASGDPPPGGPRSGGPPSGARPPAGPHSGHPRPGRRPFAGLPAGLVTAGLAVGTAGSLKLFAWPVALVLMALAATHGRRALLGYGLPAVGLPVLALLPALATDAGAAVENTVGFPLGRGLVSSPAASPLPGHLIAVAVPGGRLAAAALLGLAGLGILAWLVRRPPADAAAAALVCAYGLGAAIALLPATRFGYLLYPVAYAAWYPALRGAAVARASAEAELPAGTGSRAHAGPGAEAGGRAGG
jgi:hypothetical protein